MSDIIRQMKQGDKRALSRAISIIENETGGYADILSSLQFDKQTPIIGITGPPGAGKSTLINALAGCIIARQKKVAIIAVDPSSPFNHGALMGDRLRMSEHFLHEDVFIRSMATRGSLGGLTPRIYEVADLIRAAGFDYVIIETVGVGQSEVEIAALADTTVLVLVPEAGDEIQTIKSGVMEVADIFVLNKADRDGADVFYKNLATLAHTHMRHGWEAPVVKTVAMKNEGVEKLLEAIDAHHRQQENSDKKARLLAERAVTLIKDMRTKDVSFEKVEADLKKELQQPNFNLYTYIKKYLP
jgi:LAO/AO transport system kinase